jgi:hypothetical protein
MKAIHNLKGLSLCALAARSMTLATGSLRAQDIPAALNLALVGYVQNPAPSPTKANQVVSQTASAVRFTTATLMAAVTNANGTSFTVSGVSRSTKVLGAPNTKGNQIEMISAIISAAGTGTALNPDDKSGGEMFSDVTTWSGTISASGSAIVPANY